MANALKEWVEKNQRVINQSNLIDFKKSLLADDSVNNACNLIFKHINLIKPEEKQDIVIFCDYDVDGVMSGKVAYESLLLAGANPEHVHVFPDDRTHGFGLQESYIPLILERYPETGLLITTDNGTASGNAPQMLKDKGIDVVITDHHPENSITYNQLGYFNKALVNINSLESEYKFKGLSGTGVVWKLFQSYFYFLANQDKTNEIKDNVIPKFHELIPYVSLSIISDSMPVVDENRNLLIHGLKQINNLDEEIDDFWSVMRATQINKFNPQIDEETFGWGIAPMINAVSRIYLEPELALFALGVFRNEPKQDEMLDKVLSLTDTDKDKANLSELNKVELAVQAMQNVNQLRKSMVDELINNLGQEEVLTVIQPELLSEETIQRYQKITGRERVVLSSIAGIIAARIAQDTNQPSLVISKEINKEYEELFSGSARSDFVDITSLDESNSGIKGLHVHGHAHAAGIFIEPNCDIDEICEKIEEYIPTQPVLPDNSVKSLSPDSASISMLEEIADMKPFGNGLEEPTFEFNINLSDQFNYATKVKTNSRSHKEHLNIVDKKNDIEIMVWNINMNPNFQPYLLDLRAGKPCPLNIRFSTPIRISEFRGKKSMEAKLNHYELKVF